MITRLRAWLDPQPTPAWAAKYRETWLLDAAEQRGQMEPRLTAQQIAELVEGVRIRLAGDHATSTPER